MCRKTSCRRADGRTRSLITDSSGTPKVEINTLADVDAVARSAAAFIAEQARAAVAARGRFNLGVSGGRTPWLMLGYLADNDVPWAKLELIQVDERIAPKNDPDRNLLGLGESLKGAPLRPEQIHAMPVESADLSGAAASYAKRLQSIAGSPPVLDLAHLGLGAD